MVRSEDCDRLIDLNAEPESSIPCSICFDLVTYDGERSRAKLKCGHEFHLDCIGSAFNVKGTMQCPNCRAIEKGQWLYSSGSPACPELSMDDGSVDHYPFYFTLTELPYRVHICPFRGFTQVHPSSQSNLGVMSTFAPIVTHQHPGPNSHPHPHPHPHPHGWVQFQNTAFLHHHQASGLPMLISRSTGRFGAPRSMPRLMPSGQVYDFNPNFLPYADSSPRTWSRDNVPHFLLP